MPLEVTIDASGSSGVEGIVLLEWDCDGDGVYEAESDWTVPTARTHTCTYTDDGTYEPAVRATNSLVRGSLSHSKAFGRGWLVVWPVGCRFCSPFWCPCTLHARWRWRWR